MFFRRISSCILLVIIVLSGTRNPIIASAAEESSRNELKIRELSDEWEILKSTIETLKQHFDRTEPFISRLCALIMTHISSITAPAEVSLPDDNFFHSNGHFVSQIQQLLKLNLESQDSITLNANFFTLVILWLHRFPHNYPVNALITDLIRELKQPELVQEVMKCLTVARTEESSNLSESIWHLMKHLFIYAKKFGVADSMRLLSKVLVYENLREIERDYIIEEMKTLFEFAKNSHHWAEITNTLSQISENKILSSDQQKKIEDMIKM